MTLDEARANIGNGVVYDTGHGPREDGVITSVVSGTGLSGYVRVRYHGDAESKATRPEDLVLLSPGVTACARHNGGTGPCRVLEHFDTMPEALAWAREAATYERTRFLVRFDRGRSRYDPRAWEAIQTWLRTM